MAGIGTVSKLFESFGETQKFKKITENPDFSVILRDAREKLKIAQNTVREKSQAQTEEEQFKAGVENTVLNCLKIKPGEKIVIITDDETLPVSLPVFNKCEKISPGNVIMFNMDHLKQKRSLDGKDTLIITDDIKNALVNADVSFYMAGCKPGELQSFRFPLLDCVQGNKKLRHAHMPYVTKEIMAGAMRADYEEVSKLTGKIHKIMTNSKKVEVKGKNGTNFTVELNPEWKWIINDGLIKPGQWSNLPDGELFTAAYKIPEGKIVIDNNGALGDYFDSRYKTSANLKETPVILIIKDCKVTDIQCANKEILADLKQYIKQDNCSDKVVEFAIGTNIALTKLIGNGLQDEKFPGVHVSIGDGYVYEEVSGGKMESNNGSHLDCILPGVTVTAYDKNDKPAVIMENGVFKI